MNDERWNRLAAAILLQAVRDFKTYARELNKKNHHEVAMMELKQIISFINSDWFDYLADYHCPHLDCLNKLMKHIENPIDQKELNKYIKESYRKYLNEKKHGD